MRRRSFGRFIDVLGQSFAGCATLLDVGCGASSPTMHHRHRVARSVGADAHLPSLLTARAAGTHHAYCCIDLNDLGAVFEPKSFDCVVALDVIEHFTKPDANALLAAMERIARRRVIAMTPNGFLPQAASTDNPFQQHISGWTADEMHTLGYDVIGMNGWKALRGEYAEPRTPKWLTERLSLATEEWFESRPRHAFHLFCVKNVGAAS